MKKPLILLGMTLAMIAAKAQLPDMGQVRLTIAEVGGIGGEIPAGTYLFSADNGSNQGFAWSDDKQYIDCSFGTDFTKGTRTFNITGTFRVWHPRAGTFLLRKGADGDDPPNLATFHLNVDNSTVLTDQKAGASGTVVVTTLAPAKGGFLTGSFDVTVGDSPNPDVVLHLYRLTGTFRLNNTQ